MHGNALKGSAVVTLQAKENTFVHSIHLAKTTEFSKNTARIPLIVGQLTHEVRIKYFIVTKSIQREFVMKIKSICFSSAVLLGSFFGQV
ncbi:hypothetical protein EBR21_18165, partial [bacterium]|nr:hypothetical protein [bacterium]